MADSFMSFEALAGLRKDNASWKLLSADDAPFCCAFFYHEFIENNVRNLPEARLLIDLRPFILEKYNEEGRPEPADEDLAGIAKTYLKTWSDDSHRWLHRFNRSHQTYYDLTTAGQKAVEWLMGLKPRAFIGTESRLHTFFHLLHEIEHEANPDRQERLRYLRAQRKALDEKIKKLRDGGEVEVLGDVQVKERFMEAMDIAGGILSDFREVKDRFQVIYNEFRDEVNEWEHGKGALLTQFIADQELIGKSEQGRSFSAFFDYLMAPTLQEDFDGTMKKIQKLPALQGELSRYDALHIKRAWVDGAEDVQETIAKLSESISWYVNENNLAEKRNIYFQIKEIGKKAMAMKGREPKDKAFMTLPEAAPTINLPMERPLKMPPAKMELAEAVLEMGQQQGDLTQLFNQVYVDKDELRGHIDALLEKKPLVTLKDVLDAYPLEKGLFELLAYMEIAKAERHRFLSAKDRIFFTGLDGKTRYVVMDRIVFERKG